MLLRAPERHQEEKRKKRQPYREHMEAICFLVQTTKDPMNLQRYRKNTDTKRIALQDKMRKRSKFKFNSNRLQGWPR